MDAAISSTEYFDLYCKFDIEIASFLIIITSGKSQKLLIKAKTKSFRVVLKTRLLHTIVFDLRISCDNLNYMRHKKLYIQILITSNI